VYEKERQKDKQLYAVLSWADNYEPCGVLSQDKGFGKTARIIVKM
jgi:hypothetical protein